MDGSAACNVWDHAITRTSLGATRKRAIEIDGRSAPHRRVPVKRPPAVRSTTNAASYGTLPDAGAQPPSASDRRAPTPAACGACADRSHRFLHRGVFLVSASRIYTGRTQACSSGPSLIRTKWRYRILERTAVIEALRENGRPSLNRTSANKLDSGSRRRHAGRCRVGGRAWSAQLGRAACRISASWPLLKTLPGRSPSIQSSDLRRSFENVRNCKSPDIENYAGYSYFRCRFFALRATLCPHCLTAVCFNAVQRSIGTQRAIIRICGVEEASRDNRT